MEIGVCVKRVPAVGGTIVLTAGGQDVDTRMAGFTISPHEECAVEEAVRLVERMGGTSVVLTLGPEVAIEQLRDAMSLGIDRGVLLETEAGEWDPQATSAAIADAVRSLQGDQGLAFELLLFGNEAFHDVGHRDVLVRHVRSSRERSSAFASEESAGGRRCTQAQDPSRRMRIP